MASIITQLQQHPSKYLGPLVADAIVQSLQTGLLVDMSISFWNRSRHESPQVKYTVGFVSIVALYQTATVFYAHWHIFVQNFGVWPVIIELHWQDRIQSIVTAALASPIQCFLIRRCWILTDKSWLILVPLVALLLANIALSIYVAVAMFSMVIPPMGPPIYLIPVIDLNLILTAVLDISVTTIILTSLLRARGSAYTRHFRRILRRLISMSWEAAVPPSLCALLAAIIYMVNEGGNYWFLFFQAILGKLYAMSFLIILNARASLQDGTDWDKQAVNPSLRIEVQVPVVGDTESDGPVFRSFGYSESATEREAFREEAKKTATTP
ncbi:hypothetical protein JAAARDRAFT_688885 [Jaapia argillacea MUCL 33604]|uniref:DUF6534 domain-containing protein n=1 Tax=Jaapia argillacea MUCL 33604 TaxID=933084 RepID=A0A067PR41_9AGAM|nr:hypothetical protein JAAARDRAFT_688885 [Jaapia argillacea MUCL 33604]